VVDQQHRVPGLAEGVDQRGEIRDLSGGQPGEGLVHQHHLGVARHRPRQLHAAEIGEGQGGRKAVQHTPEPHTPGDCPRPFLHLAPGAQSQQAVR